MPSKPKKELNLHEAIAVYGADFLARKAKKAFGDYKKGKQPKAKAKPVAAKKGVLSSLKARRSKRQEEGKWTLGEKLTKAGRARAKKRGAAKGTRKLTQSGRQKAIGASKKTYVSKGAKSVVKTKGGEYVKYAKGSESAKSFRSAFKLGCEGGAKGFSWQGRKYSCKKK